MPLAAGTRLGPYEVLSPIGKGGMGEVYRARDTKLGREVAIKVLPEAFASDPERLARFEREAKVLASLKHANIASIHGFEESGDVSAIVLELVEGPTLAERIAQGAIPVDEALAIGRQIAEALEAGHEAGVIHRDLKPANIKLKEDGTVKVLDYGLAKALAGDAVGSTDSELSQSPTLTRQGTQVGVILGTAAYMSPEQAKGKRVDKRTDIFAFGAVLFEMLTGKRAFDGDSASDVLASVIKLEPDWDALPPGRSKSVDKLLHRCLEKDSRRRLRDIGDARFDLLEMEDGEDGADATGRSANPSPPLWSRSIPWVSITAVGVLALLVLLGKRASGPEVTRFAMRLPQGTVLTRGSGVAVSPDGRTIVYSASDAEHGGARLFRRDMDALESIPIRGTEGAQRPFFSPDGKSVGFFTTYEVPFCS